jgi:ADP-ribose pyrophosphatase
VESLPARRVGSRTVARVAFLTVDVDTFRDAHDHEFERVSVRHPGAVAVVPIDGNEVILIRQFRAPLGEMLLEIPAGKTDVDGEPRESTAVRECEEETGYRPGKLEHLRTIHTTPGFSDERIDLFVATELIHVGARPDGVEEHHAEIVRMKIDDVRKAIAEGRITDAKTLIGLQDVLSSSG